MSYKATLTRYVEVALVRHKVTLAPVPLEAGPRYFKNRQSAVAWVKKTNSQFGAGTAIYNGESIG